MNRFSLFLHGRYLGQHIEYYQKLVRGTFKVAVDGGLRFFLMSGVKPDLLIGDLDSLRPSEIKTVPSGRTLRFPREKDKTDSHLALEYCLEHDAGEIQLIMPSVGEVDHFWANFLMVAPLMDRFARSIRVTFHNHAFRADWLQNGVLRMDGAVGDVVSILPVTRSKLTGRGLRFGADRITVKPGDTRPLRNRIVGPKAFVELQGKAWVIRYYSRS